MRKTLEVVGLGLLAILYWITYAALHGPERLPDRIPTHFDVSGQPNGWGSPQVLWLLPIIGTCLYLLMTALAAMRFRRVNLPVTVTENNLPFIQEQTGLMVTWIKVEVLCLFLYIQWAIIRGAQTGAFRLSPLMVPLFLVVVLATVGCSLAVIIRGAREHANP
jgi:uncharacterized membrane protein